jgi:beta-galactosidase
VGNRINPLLDVKIDRPILRLAEQGNPRERLPLDDNWKFQIGDPQDGASPSLDDSPWRSVNLPHDWSIESKTDPKASTGGGGGFFPSGVAWYRQKFQAPMDWKGKQIEVEFEGVYENASIYLNGKKLFTQPYGYSTFFVDLTSDLRIGDTNELAVRVDNSQQKNSRWYSGSGIYRHVWLHVRNPVHVIDWGVCVRTESVTTNQATLSLSTEVTNPGDSAADLKIVSEIFGPSGSLAKVSTPVQVPAKAEKQITHKIEVKSPPLWAPEDPRMSRVVTRVIKASDDSIIDEVVTPFGIRKLAWNEVNGFTINGRTYKIKGGCVHHDNGVLGACAFDRAEERKVEVLKAAGFNAIRTAHNPYSPAFLAACDRLGMMVMENSFDCWTKGKNAKDYSLYFKDWWKRDLDTMILRDRNHPSIVLWDIGNEVPDIYEDPAVAAYAPKMVQEVHALDSTRPVTIASRVWPKAQDMPTAEKGWAAQDIVGSNYSIANHIKRHDQFPNRVLLSTESFGPFGEWQSVLKTPYLIGDFIWTAQDYLGEVGCGRWLVVGNPGEPLDKPDPKKPGEEHYFGFATDKLYPWHGAPCGLVDILGFAKPIIKNWNTRWQTDRVKLGMAVRQPESDTVKIKVFAWGGFPVWDSWTWPDWVGKPIQVEVYSTYPKTRLYLNDKVVGEQATGNDGKTTYQLNYAPGVLKAVALDKDNKEVEQTQLSTAGEAAALCLTPDRTTITADGQDLSFVRVEVVDKDGKLNPNAKQLVHFTLTGPGSIAGLGNANLKDETPYKGVECRVDHGVALVVLRSTHQEGAIILKATSDGLAPAETVITTQRPKGSTD